MKIDFRDLKSQYKRYEEAIDSSIKEVLNSSNFILGNQVDALERKLADYVRVSNCITCANGTDAMSLILLSQGIGVGDAVFVPNFTFFATGEVVGFYGATPIFIDVNIETFNIDALSLEKAIEHVKFNTNLKPRMIISVDLFGLPSNYGEIEPIASKHDLFLLEDSAQGFGGSFAGRRACSFGNAAITSFYPAKPLGCYGDGGAIFTNNNELADSLRSLRNHGTGNKKYNHLKIGLNSRLDTIQAAILLVKLNAFVDHELEEVGNVAKQYNEGLRDWVIVPDIPSGFSSSYAQYTIKCTSKAERDGLSLYLNNKGIPNVVYYPIPLSDQFAFKNRSLIATSIENSRLLSEISLSLPIHPYMTSEQVKYVIASISEFLS